MKSRTGAQDSLKGLPSAELFLYVIIIDKDGENRRSLLATTAIPFCTLCTDSTVVNKSLQENVTAPIKRRQESFGTIAPKLDVKGEAT